ncbi:MAG: porin [Proteobacteria bacterium]|nr:porin [Desulfobacula sp.]MBU4129937.1 porin [Pseudomonadota bacterium]
MKKLMVMVAALAMITSSAYAADWNFYGSARISTFYVNTDTISTTTEKDNYEQALQGNARIGAKVKVSDELTGRFEYGAAGGNANIRLLYGEWNFGAGSFLVGQDYAPLNWFYSDQVFDGDADLLPYGGVYSGRVGQLKLTFGGFQVALVPAGVSTTGVAATSTEVKIPGIEAAYVLNLDNFALKFGGGYQTYEAQVGARTFDIDSYVVALGAQANFGAFYAGGNVYTGQNAGNLISIDVDGGRTWNDGVAVLSATQVVDNEVWGAMIAAGYKVNDMFNIEAGYGYVKTELDNAANTENQVDSYYLNTTVTLAPGVFFVPEIGRIDGDEANDFEVTYYGVKWQINF